MESTVAHPAWWLQAYAWAEARKKQLLYCAVGLAGVALVVSFYLTQRSQREVAAAEALSAAAMPAMAAAGKETPPEAFLKVATDYAGTRAGAFAMLRAGTAYYASGKHPEAQAQFERFVRENRESPLLGQALFGVAGAYDAQGKANEAIERYRNLIDRRPNDPMIPQAKLNLGRLYESQNKPELAKPLYEQVARTSPFGGAGADASLRLNALIAKHPELAVTAVAATNAASASLNATNR